LTVSRLHKPKRTPTALTATEVNAIRAVIKAWELTRRASGPNPDGQLGQIVEALAIRRRDLDLTTMPATLRICGTVRRGAIGLKCPTATLFGKSRQPADGGARKFPEQRDILFR
jgi:hypothetical protein